MGDRIDVTELRVDGDSEVLGILAVGHTDLDDFKRAAEERSRQLSRETDYTSSVRLTGEPAHRYAAFRLHDGTAIIPSELPSDEWLLTLEDGPASDRTPITIVTAEDLYPDE